MEILMVMLLGFVSLIVTHAVQRLAEEWQVDEVSRYFKRRKIRWFSGGIWPHTEN